MKKIFLAVIALITLIACDKKETVEGANVHITGNVEGLSQGKLYLQKSSIANILLILH